MKNNQIIMILLLVFVLTTSIFAAGEIDTTFNPDLRKALPASNNETMVIQPDGKILVLGSYQENSANYYYLRRLNEDGSQDTSFQANIPLTFFGSAVVQTDGKILVGGSINFLTAKIIRLNSNGSLDNSFESSEACPQFFSCSRRVYASQSDGKIYASTTFSGSGFSSESFKRFNSDGSPDTSFASLGFDLRNSQGINKLLVLPTGKLMIGGKHSSFGELFRLNQDGTKDTTFESPILGGSGITPSSVSSFILKPDGKIIFSGIFQIVNGLSRSLVCRLNIDGSVDTQYTGASNQSFVSAEPLSNGKYYAITSIIITNTLVRFNSDDTVDTTFNSVPIVDLYRFGVDSQDRVVTPNFRLNINGSLDTSFNRQPFQLNGKVSLLAKQTDGKIIVIGDFITANSISKTRFARLNADGTTDNSFNAGTGFDVAPKGITVQSDGKILAFGDFTNYNGTARVKLIRINSDGSLDTTFNPVLDGQVYAVSPLSNGKILIGGNFSAFNGIARPRLARLNADGTLDSTFNASINSDVSSTVEVILAQTDGKFLISGWFNSVGGISRNRFARINADGSLDASFNTTATDYRTTSIAQQSDGKYVYLERTAGTYNLFVKRLNIDGSFDNSFQTATITHSTNELLNSINALQLQSDGFIVIGGDFGRVNNIPKYNIARLKPNGSLDSLYIQTGANAKVNAIVGQPDGKIIVGGDFSSIENTARTGLARINVIPSVNQTTPFDFDGDGKSDISVFRPANRFWYGLNSSNSAFYQFNFGAVGDVLAPADYNFDGKCDIAIFRQSNGQWWYQAPNGQHTLAAVWGQAGDKPIPSDWDGDGKSDFIVYRPSNGVWYRLSSGTGQTSFAQFGIAEDIPLQADFDGDGKSDLAVYRPSTGTWYWLNSSNNQFGGVPFGTVGDIPQAGDYDGDGKTDFAVYRPSNGFWYFLYSGSGYSFGAIPFGVAEDRPTVADYDGDGKTDIAVFRPSSGTWYLQRSQAGFAGITFGTTGDIPIPSVYYP
jgi:uncharacterized delta-60 repeat protein